MDRKANRVAGHVRVQEFYFQSGAMLGSSRAQCDYASINYTQVARDLAAGEPVHAIVHLIARRGSGANARYSLSCNPDVTLDLLDAISARGKPRPLMIAVIHPDLPFLGGAADVPADFFDRMIEQGDAKQPRFALPRNAVDPVEYAIGLHSSTLVRAGRGSSVEKLGARLALSAAVSCGSVQQSRQTRAIQLVDDFGHARGCARLFDLRQEGSDPGDEG